MVGKAKSHATHIPEPKSPFWSLVELAIGPGLMLIVLLALGAHLIINHQSDELGLYAAGHSPEAR